MSRPRPHTPAPDAPDDLVPTDLDLAVVVGSLSSDPVATTLPSGSTLIRYEVTVRDAAPADTVPVSWLDPSRPPALAAGDRVVVVGRVRRRFFRAGGATRSATEVVAGSVSRPRSTRAAVAAVEAAAAVLASMPAGERR
jgi:single-strand DNA-binding protein